MRQRPSSLSSSFTNRGLVYLLEPIMAAVVVIVLIALFLPEAGTEKNYRLLGLHAQDVAAVIQKAGLVQNGCEEIEGEVGRLVKELNPRYDYCFRMYGSGECGEACGGMCASRGWADANSSIKIEVCLSG